MFVHDAVQQAAYKLMSQEERYNLHYHIGAKLVSKMAVSINSETEYILFIAIDHINKAKSVGVTDPHLHEVFASLNLKVAENAFDVSDFLSAVSYIEFGISFLGGESWETNYKLTLQLFDNACVVYYVNTLPDKMAVHIEAVLTNASCLYDKLKAYLVMIKSLATSNQI